MLSTESSFTIAIPEEKLFLLRRKLDLVVFPDELEDAGMEYGAPLANIRRLVARWKEGYDWRKPEAQINAELPQYTRDIDVEGFGILNIHYVHKQSEVVGAIPLLFVHGWPGHFLEVRKILPLLLEASTGHPSFHVVALSLPGHGFSTAPTRKGFAISQYAEERSISATTRPYLIHPIQVGNKLMLALGYNVTQGGDWGSVITYRMAVLSGGKHVKAMHTNLPLHTAAEEAGLKRTEWFRTKGSGYFAAQSTKPQTLGYGLADSPVSLLAWIYEKLVAWTDDYPWDDDEGTTGSLRTYYEATQTKPNLLLGPSEPATIPVGYSHFPKEIIIHPRSWLEPKPVFEAEHESGGHFAAYEKPVELVEDLRKMFGKAGPAFAVVPGRIGYV